MHILNVATWKTYHQISNYTGDNRGAASNAADGNTEGHYFQGSCSHTAETDPSGVYPWWEVDLGGTYPVHDITVWARDGKTSQTGTYWNDHLYPFTITVDNKTCISVTSAPSTRNNLVRCTSVMYGRVVRLTLDRTDQTLNLCEFQVFEYN
ncbi:fucolectin-6-like [Littorina saxatilis]|uniref:fucolectin-6-like n=1 Tax=Littorina saxatilis TaxID=31220 RepID=UPI0038B66511